MSMGTFDAFTAARLGIYAAQQGLQVTGNNVSNINTEGYTRQRLDQVSFKAGAYDKYRSQMENRVGSGALVMNINQIRDPYLDVRYRNISAEVGYTNKKLDGLQQIADILDEVGLGEDPASNEKGDGLLYAQIQDLSSKLRAYADEPTKTNNDLVRGSAETLCLLLNKYAERLETLYQETKKDFSDKVDEINECLTNIRDLNREIRDNEIYGDNALELRDERNRQIDKLSEFLHIKVVYGEEDIGNAQKVEKLSIYLDDDNPDGTVHTDESLLIDGIFGVQLSSPELKLQRNPDYGKPDSALKDFLYLMDVKEEIHDPEKPDDPDATITVTNTKGTNDPKKANRVVNDDFAIELSKLYDAKGREWTGVSSNFDEVDNKTQEILDRLLKSTVEGPDPEGSKWSVKTAAVKAVYSFDFTPQKPEQEPGGGGPKPIWEDGQSLIIGGNTYTIGDGGDLSVADADDPEKMLSFIVDKLKAEYNNNNDAKFDVSVDPDNPTKILFTAKEGGAIPASEQPKLEPVPESDPEGKLTFTGPQTEQRGKDAVLTPPDPESTKDTPEFGTTTTISYVWSGSGWKQKTTFTTKTFEVGLDDNDLYGSFQAIRELLTGSGEFATQDTIDNIDENAAKERGIPYYQKALDLLALQFATQYNQINQGYAVDKDGNYLAKVTEVDKNGKPVYETLPEQTVTYYESLKGEYLGMTPPQDMKPEEYKIVKDVKLNLYMTDNAKKAFDDYFKTVECQDEDGNPIEITDEEGNPVTDEEGNTSNLTYAGLRDYLDQNGEPMGGLLFSNRNDRDSEGNPNDPNDPIINASNISVAHKWSTGVVDLVPKYEILFGGDLEATTQNKNANHMVNMIEKSLVYNPRDVVADAGSTVLFKGSFNDMFSRLNTTLGDDIRATNIALNTSYTQRTEIDTSREGVSGVDLNDEAMNMMQFQKALNAAMRLMTVIDEALDRLINNTGIAGR